jgi:hypothetical protein
LGGCLVVGRNTREMNLVLEMLRLRLRWQLEMIAWEMEVGNQAADGHSRASECKLDSSFFFFFLTLGPCAYLPSGPLLNDIPSSSPINCNSKKIELWDKPTFSQ